MFMETSLNKQLHKESGFALLMSLVVVGVLLSIGLSVLELSIKQIELSTNFRDSESAFHAANAGGECGLYWRRNASSTMEAGGVITPAPECFDEFTDTVNSFTPITGVDVTGSGAVYNYEYDFTSGSGVDQRCSLIQSLVFVADPTGIGLTLHNVDSHLAYYPDGNSIFCEAGARCTVISVRGYNKPCGEITNFGTLQREVLLEF